MSVKAIVFVDGNWLYRSRPLLFTKLGEENGFEIDYRKLPKVLCEDLANYLDADVDIVRTAYFGTIPSSRSGYNTAKQSSFYDFLERSCGYETEIHEIDIGGPGEPRNDEHWVDIALASSALYYAAQTASYDIAVVVGDDPNYAPALRRLRQLGKRVQVVGIHGADGKSVQPGAVYTQSRTCDFPPIFLDTHAADIKLVREMVKRTCKQCGKEEMTTWAGPEFFCSDCRGKHRGTETAAEPEQP